MKVLTKPRRGVGVDVASREQAIHILPVPPEMFALWRKGTKSLWSWGHLAVLHPEALNQSAFAGE